MAYGMKMMIAGVAIFAANAAVAQQTCLERDVIVAKLDEGYNEKPLGRGLQGEARLFEVFVAEDGTTWTIVQSYPSGMSCIMAAGTHWHQSDMAELMGVDG